MDVTHPADLAALTPLTDAIEAFCAAAGIDAGHVSALALAVEELLVNLVHYGRDGLPGPGEVCVHLSRRDDALVLVFEDDGNPFDPTATPDPNVDASLEEREIGGLGLYIIRALMEMSYVRVGPRNRVTLVKRLTEPAG